MENIDTKNKLKKKKYNKKIIIIKVFFDLIIVATLVSMALKNNIEILFYIE